MSFVQPILRDPFVIRQLDTEPYARDPYVEIPTEDVSEMPVETPLCAIEIPGADDEHSTFP